MCGIVGVASPGALIDCDFVMAMRDTMVHRGPDDGGIWSSEDGQVCLAQRRLAIIDLSPGGHQPMTDSSGHLCITFNGEIYNFQALRDELAKHGHRFQSSSDTEVIMAAYLQWGEECLRHLNGMFAFALYDKRVRRLFLARDRAGEKPLFYKHDSSGLLFGSELKALLKDPRISRKLNLSAFESYLAYGYVMGQDCIIDGIRKLPPSYFLRYELDKNCVSLQRYWSVPPQDISPSSDEELAEQLESLLKESVRTRLIADVPVGIMLSGGLDSSLVTAFAAQLSGKKVRTFNVSFAGARSFDEAPYARLVAKHFDTDHVELQAEASVDLLPALARQFDEPIADYSMVPTYTLSHAIRQHVTVALGGDGADELFGGYKYYSWLLWLEQAQNAMPGLARQFVGSAAKTVLPVGVRGRQYLIGLCGTPSEMLRSANVLFNEQDRRKLVTYSLPAEGTLSPESARSATSGTELSVLRRATYMDFTTYLPENILVKIDRASMLASLEMRAPFLDHRIVEFAFARLRDSLRATKKERKCLLRRIARRHLPAALDTGRKQGFSPPLRTWFQSDWGEFIRDIVARAGTDLFRKAYLNRLILAEKRGLVTGNRLFAIALFELWRREYAVSV